VLDFFLFGWVLLSFSFLLQLQSVSPLQAASAIAGVLEQLLFYYVRADDFPLHTRNR
jgi:hypothetical protein